ncbi:hypothetical protein Cfor_02778 [Coptotermes formosanus]|uniref:Major facilitator superfamily (MFS) profile domain-containing protein n=1 Tax=Coptotermes formosanus TaxID=36987 RepID=A0A6L2Q7H6_COPFO|nr:hypothetical protein Cfor_02778 [Coptotermes formosanus]
MHRYPLILIHTKHSCCFSHRTTGCGFMSATYRLGGILGTVTFNNLVSASRAAPMLTTAAVLLFGGIVSLKLPETRSVLL